MADQKIGPLLDSLGLTADLGAGDLPTDALVLMKVIKQDGAVALIKGKSESLDWITGLGMPTAALEVENAGYERVDTGEDE